MRKALLSPMLAALGLVLLVGCQEADKGPRTVTAEGTLTLDGQPVKDAAVVFTDAAGQYSARGRTDEEGKFSLDAFEYKTGAVPGTYMWFVTRTVVEDVPPEEVSAEEAEHAAGEGGEGGGGTRVYNDLPQKYSTPTQDRTLVIPEDGTSDLTLELTSD